MPLGQERGETVLGHLLVSLKDYGTYDKLGYGCEGMPMRLVSNQMPIRSRAKALPMLTFAMQHFAFLRRLKDKLGCDMPQFCRFVGCGLPMILFCNPGRGSPSRSS
jgi:hypothetical protein